MSSPASPPPKERGAAPPVTSARDLRLAQVCAVLARATANEEIAAADALRIIRHELRRRNTNKALKIPLRSREAQRVIDEYAERGTQPPQNGSPEALHADHVFSLTSEHMLGWITVGDWLRALADLDLVVCVTAAENYRLQQLERGGYQGWAKYGAAGIEIIALQG